MREKGSSYYALKLDMRKAYDRLGWDYSKAMMWKLGFSPTWVQIVMAMVQTVSFSVLFNREILDQLQPIRVIRQGDPISPYLFLIAVEGL